MQVSNQCMALVRDEVLVPTKDAPELAYIRLVTSNIQKDNLWRIISMSSLLKNDKISKNYDTCLF